MRKCIINDCEHQVGFWRYFFISHACERCDDVIAVFFYNKQIGPYPHTVCVGCNKLFSYRGYSIKKFAEVCWHVRRTLKENNK